MAHITRVNPDKMRRVLERSRALTEAREHQMWLDAMTLEHRAMHEGSRVPYPPCMECLREGLRKATLNAAQMSARYRSRA